MAKTLPDEIPVTRRVHQGALKMILRQASIIAEHRVEVLDDIAERLSADHNIELTGEELRRDFQTDKDAKGKPNGLMVKRTRATKLPDGNAKGKP